MRKIRRNSQKLNSQKNRINFNPGRIAVLAGIALAVSLSVNTSSFALDPYALPTGATNLENTTVSSGVNVMNVKTDGASGTVGKVDWATYNIGSASTVNYEFTNTGQVSINKVTGGSPSQIFGSITQQIGNKGAVFLINPNGVLFGAGSSVNVDSLTVSTLNGTYDAGTKTLNLSRTGTANGIYIDGGANINVTNSASFASNAIYSLGNVASTTGKVQFVTGDGVNFKYEVAANSNLIAKDVQKSDITGANSTGLPGDVVYPDSAHTVGSNAVEIRGGSISAPNIQVMSKINVPNIAMDLVNLSGVMTANTIAGDSGNIYVYAHNADASGSVDSGMVGVRIGQQVTAGSSGSNGNITVEANKVSFGAVGKLKAGEIHLKPSSDNKEIHFDTMPVTNAYNVSQDVINKISSPVSGTTAKVIVGNGTNSAVTGDIDLRLPTSDPLVFNPVNLILDTTGAVNLILTATNSSSSLGVTNASSITVDTAAGNTLNLGSIFKSTGNVDLTADTFGTVSGAVIDIGGTLALKKKTTATPVNFAASELNSIFNSNTGTHFGGAITIGNDGFAGNIDATSANFGSQNVNLLTTGAVNLSGIVNSGTINVASNANKAASVSLGGNLSTIGNIYSIGNVGITSTGNLATTGVISAGGDVFLMADSDYTGTDYMNIGGDVTGAHVTLDVDSGLTLAANIISTDITQLITINSNADITISNTDNSSCHIPMSRLLSDHIKFDNDSFASNQFLTYGAPGEIINATGKYLDIWTGNYNPANTINAAGITIHANLLNLTQALVDLITGNVSLSANNIHVVGNISSTGKAYDLTATSLFDFDSNGGLGSSISSNGSNIAISAGMIDLTNGTLSAGIGSINLIQTAGNLMLRPNNLMSANINATASAGDIIFTNSLVGGTSNYILTANDFITAGYTLGTSGNVELHDKSGSITVNNSFIGAFGTGTLKIYAEDSASGNITVSENVTANRNLFLNAHGAVSTGLNIIDLGLGTLDLTALGNIDAQIASANVNVQGANIDLVGTGTGLNVSAINTAGHANISGTNALGTNITTGAINTGSYATVSSTGTVAVGNITSTGNVSLTGTSLTLDDVTGSNISFNTNAYVLGGTENISTSGTLALAKLNNGMLTDAQEGLLLQRVSNASNIILGSDSNTGGVTLSSPNFHSSNVKVNTSGYVYISNLNGTGIVTVDHGASGYDIGAEAAEVSISGPALKFGNVNSSGTIFLVSGGTLNISGNVTAGNEIEVNNLYLAPAELTLGDWIIDGKLLSLNTSGINTDNHINVINVNGGAVTLNDNIQAQGTIGIWAYDNVNINKNINSDSYVEVASDKNILQGINSTITSANNIDFICMSPAGNGNFTLNGTINTTGNFEISSGGNIFLNGIINANGAGSKFEADAVGNIETTGTISVSKQVDMTADSLGTGNNHITIGGALSAGGAITFNADDSLTNTAAITATAGDLITINANVLNPNAVIKSQTAGGTNKIKVVKATGDINISSYPTPGTIITDTLEIDATSGAINLGSHTFTVPLNVILNAGTAITTGDLAFTGLSNLTLAAGTSIGSATGTNIRGLNNLILSSGGDINISTGLINNIAVNNAANLNINGGSNAVNITSLPALITGNVDITGAAITTVPDLTANGHIIINGSLLTLGNITSNSDSISLTQTAGNLSLYLDRLNAGNISATAVAGDINLASSVTGKTGAYTLTANGFNPDVYSLGTSGNVLLHDQAGGITVNTALVNAFGTGNLTIVSDGNVTLNDTAVTGRSIAIAAQGTIKTGSIFDYGTGSLALTATNDIDVDLQGTGTVTATTTGGNILKLEDVAAGETFTVGNIIANKDAEISSKGNLVTTGIIIANGDVTLTADSDNAGAAEFMTIGGNVTGAHVTLNVDDGLTLGANIISNDATQLITINSNADITISSTDNTSYRIPMTRLLSNNIKFDNDDPITNQFLTSGIGAIDAAGKNLDIWTGVYNPTNVINADSITVHSNLIYLTQALVDLMTGNVTLASNNIHVLGNISSTGKAYSLTANNLLDFDLNGGLNSSITSNNSNISINAGTINFTNGSLNAGTGTISLTQSAGDFNLDPAKLTANNISATASAGNMILAANLSGSSANYTLTANNFDPNGHTLGTSGNVILNDQIGGLTVNTAFVNTFGTGSLAINANGNITIDNISTNRGITLNAQGTIKTSTGSIFDHGIGNLGLTASNDIDVNMQGWGVVNAVSTGGNVKLQESGLSSLMLGSVTANGNITLTADNYGLSGTISASPTGTVKILSAHNNASVSLDLLINNIVQAHDIQIGQTGYTGDVSINGLNNPIPLFICTKGQVQLNDIINSGQINVNYGGAGFDFVNEASSVSLSGNISNLGTVYSLGYISVRNETGTAPLVINKIRTNNDIDILSNTAISLLADGQIYGSTSTGYNGISIISNGNIDLNGEVYSQKAANITSDGHIFEGTTGSIRAYGDLYMEADGGAVTLNGTTYGNQNLIVNSSSDVTVGGTLYQRTIAGTLDITSGGNITTAIVAPGANEGIIRSKNVVSLYADGGINILVDPATEPNIDVIHSGSTPIIRTTGAGLLSIMSAVSSDSYSPDKSAINNLENAAATLNSAPLVNTSVSDRQENEGIINGLDGIMPVNTNTSLNISFNEGSSDVDGKKLTLN